MEGIEVLRSSFDAFKRNLVILAPQLVLSTISTIFGLALAAWLMQFTGPGSTATLATILSALSNVLVTGIAVVLGLVVVGIIISGMYIDLAADAYKGTVKISKSFSVGLNNFVNLVLYAILIIIFYGLLFGVVAAAALAAGVGLGIMLGVCAIVGILLIQPLLLMSTVLIVLEKKGPISALKESIKIGHSHYFGIFGLIIVIIAASIVIAIIGSIVSIPFALLIPYSAILVKVIFSALSGSILILMPPIYYLMYVKQKPSGATTQKQAKKSSK